MKHAAALSRGDQFIHAKYFNLTGRQVCNAYTQQVLDTREAHGKLSFCRLTTRLIVDDGFDYHLCAV